MANPLVERTRIALSDPVLQRTLPMATQRAVEKQRHRWHELGNVDAYRGRAAEVKRHTIAHLDHYLETFERAATANGIQVHWASTRDEARLVIDSILSEERVKLVVKAKSMTTEELELTQHLSAQGIETWETDLGEFIVQLSGKPPSHITAPAIHEDTASISRLFNKHLGTPPSDKPEELAGIARRALRDKFLAADCGISGANFLIAESGRIVLVENEANIRLSTTLPRLHIAVAGIEKLVPREADLPVFLKLLARSATGQKLTAYTHMIRGPRRGAETEGPEKLHLVLLDAGRTRMLADEASRNGLTCIRCGSCLNVCPVYQAVGGHTYNAVYPGPIGAITWPWLHPDDDSRMLPYASTLCGACESSCPVEIPIPRILLHLRAKRVEEGAPAIEKMAIAGWRASVSGQRAMAAANGLGRWALRPRAREGRVGKLPLPLSGWTRHRTFPLPAKESFHRLWKRRRGGKA